MTYTLSMDLGDLIVMGGVLLSIIGSAFGAKKKKAGPCQEGRWSSFFDGVFSPPSSNAPHGDATLSSLAAPASPLSSLAAPASQTASSREHAH